MKTSKLILGIATAAIILSSCSVSIHKRQHGKGYFITSTKKMKASDSKVEDEKIEETQLVKKQETNTQNIILEKPLATASVEGANIENNITEEVNSKKEIKRDNTQIAANVATPVKTQEEKIKLNKKALKNDIKKSKYSIAEEDTVLYVILSIFIPPLAVYLQRDLGTDFWINLILTLLFWLPGVIHALLITFGKI